MARERAKSRRPAAVRGAASERPAGKAVHLAGRRLHLSAPGQPARSVPLHSASIQYYRLERSAWRPALESLAAMGLPIVELYVPWGVHEEAPGRFDFGDRDPRKDVAAFLDLVHELGLLAFVRPGPHINAEMTWFGLPERIVHDRGCQARSPRQNAVILAFPPLMFPVPSYASTTYLAEVGRWYDAVAELVAPRLYPHGPVALVQVDNEAAFYFRNGPYDQDYHPDAIAQWREFLRARYGTLEDVSDAHRRRYVSWEDVRPPTSFDATQPEELVPHLDWATFHEHLLASSVGWMRQRLEQAGVRGVPMVHNVPLGERGLPVSLPALAERFDLVGLDFYHSRREHAHVRRRALYLAGTSELPYAPELGVGAPFWFTPLAHEDSLHTALVALAYGLRGFNLYMGVERDRWYGAPVDVEGRRRASSAAWKALLEALVETGFERLERRARVALMLPREYARLTRATHLFGALAPSMFDAIGIGPRDVCREDTLGFAEPIQIAATEQLDRLGRALDRAEVPWVYVDGDAPLSRLRAFDVIVTPSFELASPERWERLGTYAGYGGRVLLGPRVPHCDEALRPATFELPRGAELISLATREDAERVAARLAADDALRARALIEPRGLEVTVHEDPGHGGLVRVLFALNPTAERARATVTFRVAADAPPRLTDALSGETFDLTDGRHEIPLGPRSARMLVGELPPAPAAAEGPAVPHEPEPARPRARARARARKNDPSRS